APATVDGRVEIRFREMSAYGYTDARDGVPFLVLHRNFQGFPDNADPEGTAVGAAKVTVAHELKHASQHVATGWTEGGWLEADATWAEDHVFPVPNDYVRYVAFGSPVSSPNAWLPASYGDCLFQQVIAATEGVDALVRFFERRATRPGESVLTSFDESLRLSGSRLSRPLETLGVWTYFCGSNAANRPVGFADAGDFPTPPLRSHLATALEQAADEVAPLGTHHVIAFRADRTGRPQVEFTGDQGGHFSLTAIVTRPTGTRSVHPLPMVTPHSSASEVPVAWEDAASVVLVATSLALDEAARYTLSVNGPDAVDVRELAGAELLRLDPARPNPFRDHTVLGFSLPAAASVRLAVYDVSGRLVRSLLEDASLAAGPHQVEWDGSDGSGRLATPGMYYYRLESRQGSASRRVLLLR
ncbi:MAG TPA: FlgD immunoglobulin-like domain containing protein, partial [bacterium]|nr:FlgD immunoglobulin-like domain containing protein [bacterium]